jgi:hypothetical protein
MNICMGELVQAIATALEIVERELIGVSTYHGKRIAALCSLMGREVGMDEEERRSPPVHCSMTTLSQSTSCTKKNTSGESVASGSTANQGSAT